ncbi:MAG: sigma-70 family RNA polymerase sigma factor [Bacilli bacterium]|nr:sigma-70 family RNA polymerase sigma factor [Bacilli bacterium]
MKYRDYNDNELVYYIRENGEEANQILFKKYEPLIHSIAKKMYPYCKYNGVDLADLIQEGMIGLNQAIQSYREENDNLFFTFAKKCIERKIITLVIASKRQKHKILNESLSLEFNGEEGDVGILESVLSDDSFHPEERLFIEEAEKELTEKVKQSLTDNEERIFDLKRAGFNYKEIASIIDKNPKTVDNALQRIKKKFRKVLEER